MTDRLLCQYLQTISRLFSFDETSLQAEFLTRDREHIERAAAKQRVAALAVPIVVHHLHANDHKIVE